jgi:hypothetical protein
MKGSKEETGKERQKRSNREGYRMADYITSEQKRGMKVGKENMWRE